MKSMMKVLSLQCFLVVLQRSALPHQSIPPMSLLVARESFGA